MRNDQYEVHNYIKNQQPERRIALEKLRNIVLNTIPGVVEIMYSGIPTYLYRGTLCAFASQKSYISFYFTDSKIINKHKTQLKKLNLGKGCIRFNQIEKLPVVVVQKMLLEAANANIHRN